MSSYTTQLRYICESKLNLSKSPANYQSAYNVINETSDLILGDYPIFDESHRKVLNNKIVKHFYFQEIGFETQGRFLFELNNKMNEIMPYYNKLYKSELIDFNPFENFNYKEIYDGNGDYRKSGDFDKIGNYDKTGNYKKSGTDRKSGEFETAENQNQVTTYGKKSDDTKTGTETKSEEHSENTTNSNSQSGTSEITYGKNTKTDDINKNTHSDNDTNSWSENGDSEKNSTNKYLATPETSITAITNNDYLTDIRMIKDTDEYNKSGNGRKDNTGQSTDDRDITVAESGKDKTTYSNSDSGNSNVTGDSSSTTSTNIKDTTQLSGTDTVKMVKNTSGSNSESEENSESGENSEQGKTGESGNNNERGDDKKHYEKTLKGNQGQANLDVLQKLRDSFLNIDMMIIRDLEILFMQIF